MKKKNNILKIEKINEENPSKLIIAERNIVKKAGRKPISKEDKGTEFIGIKITKKQKESIQKQAGITPIATFIKHKLKESGLIE
jgi:hypothetical protein